MRYYKRGLEGVVSCGAAFKVGRPIPKVSIFELLRCSLLISLGNGDVNGEFFYWVERSLEKVHLIVIAYLGDL